MQTERCEELRVAHDPRYAQALAEIHAQIEDISDEERAELLNAKWE